MERERCSYVSLLSSGIKYTSFFITLISEPKLIQWKSTVHKHHGWCVIISICLPLLPNWVLWVQIPYKLILFVQSLYDYSEVG